MPRELLGNERSFAKRWREYLDSRPAEECAETVAKIIKDVRKNGDKALLRYNRKFDNCQTLKVDEKTIRNARKRCDSNYLKALKLAAGRISEFHKKVVPEDFSYRDKIGLQLGQRWRPVASAGLYVPGGTATYPSSVLMNAIPAKIAGVGEIAVAVPSPGGKTNPQVLAACDLLGIRIVYSLGGAQAIAAMAYGTESVSKVDKITGPGNCWVNEAKRQAFGDVGIDTPAGPSEVLIIADKHATPDLIAADLLAQAEHDRMARSVLITDSPQLATEVKMAVAEQLETLPRPQAAVSWQEQGAIVLVRDILRDSPPLADEMAAEHLQLCVKKPQKLLDKINYGGSIFLGENSPEALGDYVAGPNHILPTGRTARFASGLSVSDFMVRNTTIAADDKGFGAIAEAAAVLAEAEGLDGHARSLRMRIEKKR